MTSSAAVVDLDVVPTEGVEGTEKVRHCNGFTLTNIDFCNKVEQWGDGPSVANSTMCMR